MSKNDCCNEKGHCRCKGWKCVAWVVLGIVGFAALALILGWVIMLLWNGLMPKIFSLPVITYCQAIGLAVLSRLLFGGCGGGFRHFHRKRHGRWHNCGCGCKDDSGKECCSDEKHEGDGCCQKENETKA